MKLILSHKLSAFMVVSDVRNGELVIEVTDAPGNVGKQGERLTTVGVNGEDMESGRQFSFKEEKS